MADTALLASQRLSPAKLLDSGYSFRHPKLETALRHVLGRSMTGRRAVVLLSGGMDSATAAAVARDEGFEVYALSFRYGQRHAARAGGRPPRRRAPRRPPARRARHRPAGLRRLGAHRATSRCPRTRRSSEIGVGIPVTYVPARNTIFLSFALAWAEVLGASDIFIGVNALDYSGYPDCRPEYIEAFERMANLATRAGVEGRRLRIHTPLIQLTKAEIIEVWAGDSASTIAITWSCYDPAPDGAACGRCDACLLRRKGFREAGRGPRYGAMSRKREHEAGQAVSG